MICSVPLVPFTTPLFRERCQEPGAAILVLEIHSARTRQTRRWPHEQSTSDTSHRPSETRPPIPPASASNARQWPFALARHRLHLDPIALSALDCVVEPTYTPRIARACATPDFP